MPWSVPSGRVLGPILGVASFTHLGASRLLMETGLHITPVHLVHPERAPRLPHLLPVVGLQEGVCGGVSHAGQWGRRHGTCLRFLQ